MYRDFDKADRDQHKLEDQLSALAKRAGEIMSRVKKMYDAGKKEVQLPRKDRDLLRRFLFIMMYRNSSFAKRFDKSGRDYDSDDREEMLAYMQEKGFPNPKDVWFANIRGFLKVDLSKKWPDIITDLKERAYPMDVEWFVYTFKGLSCTPKDPAENLF